MIIGISGKIGSGKDTVGKIIQALSFNSFEYFNKDGVKTTQYTNVYELLMSNFKKLGISESSTNETIALINTIAPHSNWEIKKFAYKLKEIVSLITGINIKDLESEDVKKSLLSDEFQIYSIENFGKSTKINFYTESEAKDFCIHFSNSQHAYTYKKSQRTVRWLLQYIGTDLFRDQIHNNIWVNSLFSDYNTNFEAKNVSEWGKDLQDNWIITDVRFPNEAEAIKSRNGILIRIERPRDPSILDLIESEIALDKYEGFNYKIINNGTVFKLINDVRFILQNEKIIE